MSEQKCPLCGGKVVIISGVDDYVKGGSFEFNWFSCVECNMSVVYYMPLAEAMERFARRPESVEAKVLKQFKADLQRELKRTSMSSCNMSNESELISYIRYIEKLEKELKDGE